MFLFTKLPKDSVASSINFKLYFLAIDRNFKISQGLPKICTAIMAEILLFVFLLKKKDPFLKVIFFKYFSIYERKSRKF